MASVTASFHAWSMCGANAVPAAPSWSSSRARVVQHAHQRLILRRRKAHGVGRSRVALEPDLLSGGTEEVAQQLPITGADSFDPAFRAMLETCG